MTRWPRVQLRRVAKLGTGHTPSRQHPEYWENCTIPWLTLADVWQLRDGTRQVITETSERISDLGLANSAAVLHPAGTVALSRTASVGFSCLLGLDMATSQDFATWTCGPRVLPKYLLWALRGTIDDIIATTMGSTHKTIYMPDIQEIAIQLPPVEVQEQIVRFLDAETALIDALITRKRQMIKLLRERFVSARRNAFDRLGSTSGEIALRRCVRCLDGRRIPLNAEERSGRQGKFPYWGAGSVVDWIDDYLFDETLVLLGEDGAPFFDDSRDVAFCVDERVWVNNHIHVLRPREGWSPRFLMHMLNAVDFSRYITGSTRDKLTQAEMDEIRIPASVRKSQDDAVAGLDALSRGINELRTRLHSQIDLLRERRQTLIAAAVTGELNVAKAAA